MIDASYETDTVTQAYSNSDSQATEGANTGREGLLHTLLEKLGVRKATDHGAHGAVSAIETRVLEVIRGSKQTPKSIEKIPRGFERIVKVLKEHSIKYKFGKNRIVIRYCKSSDPNSVDFNLEISYDAWQGVYTVYYEENNSKYNSLDDLMKRIEDHDFDIMSFKNPGFPGFQRRSFSTRPLSESDPDTKQLDIPDGSTLAKDLINSLSTIMRDASGAQGNPEDLSDRLKKYTISIAQSQRSRDPEQYPVIRGDSDGSLLGTAILMKAMVDVIDSTVSEDSPSETVLFDILSIIGTYITLRQTFPNKTCQAGSAYYSDAHKDILTLDKRMSEILDMIGSSIEAELADLRNRKEEIFGEKKVLEGTLLDGTYPAETINSLPHDLDREIGKIAERVSKITAINEGPLLQYQDMLTQLRHDELGVRRQYREMQAKRNNPLLTKTEDLQADPLIINNYFRRDLPIE